MYKYKKHWRTLTARTSYTYNKIQKTQTEYIIFLKVIFILLKFLWTLSPDTGDNITEISGVPRIGGQKMGDPFLLDGTFLETSQAKHIHFLGDDTNIYLPEKNIGTVYCTYRTY